VLLETSGGYGHCNLLQWLYKADPPVDEYRVLQDLVYFLVLLSVTKIRIMPYRARHSLIPPLQSRSSCFVAADAPSA
jgi:hypothetical protein